MLKFLKNLFTRKTTEKNATKKDKKAPATSKTTQLSEKEIATKRKEPWVDVVGFKVNKQNIRNGFYELDWNEYFILELKREEYGFDGDPDEEIVARWFRDVCINAAAAEGINMDGRSTGYLNVTNFNRSLGR